MTVSSATEKKDQLISSHAYPDEYKDINIMVTYSDPSGAIKVGSVKANDLSSSWVWQTPSSPFNDHMRSSQKLEETFDPVPRHEDSSEHDLKANITEESSNLSSKTFPSDPIKHQRQITILCNYC